MTVQRHGRRLRDVLLQLGAALGVGASGYVSLATSCADQLSSLMTSREVAFAEGELTRTVRVRVSPEQWESLELRAPRAVTAWQVTPVEDASGGTGAGGALPGETGGGPATGGSNAVPAPAGWGTLAVTCDPWTESCGVILVELTRLDATGAATIELEAELSVRSDCSGGPPEEMDLRLEVAD